MDNNTEFYYGGIAPAVAAAISSLMENPAVQETIAHVGLKAGDVAAKLAEDAGTLGLKTADDLIKKITDPEYLKSTFSIVDAAADTLSGSLKRTADNLGLTGISLAKGITATTTALTEGLAGTMGSILSAPATIATSIFSKVASLDTQRKSFEEIRHLNELAANIRIKIAETADSNERNRLKDQLIDIEKLIKGGSTNPDIEPEPLIDAKSHIYNPEEVELISGGYPANELYGESDDVSKHLMNLELRGAQIIQAKKPLPLLGKISIAMIIIALIILIHGFVNRSNGVFASSLSWFIFLLISGIAIGFYTGSLCA